MSRLLVVSGLLLWAGAALILSSVPWFSRTPVVERLRPYLPGFTGRPQRGGILSAESFREVVGPLSRSFGERLARLLGVSEQLDLRLTRIHSALDVTAYRMREIGWMVVGLAAGALVSLALQPPAVLAVFFVVAGPLLAFLVLEQRVAAASTSWQRRVFLELPVVAEQLATLLGAGYSLSSALNRIAARGRGACARDLTRVCGRIRQGLSEVEALREWAAVAQVDALDRLVAVLSLHREAADLGRLVSQEARAVRRDVHRELIATIERRSQQVWIPVTVATLVPGVIFLAIPFIEALRLFTG